MKLMVSYLVIHSQGHSWKWEKNVPHLMSRKTNAQSYYCHSKKVVRITSHCKQCKVSLPQISNLLIVLAMSEEKLKMEEKRNKQMANENRVEIYDVEVG